MEEQESGTAGRVGLGQSRVGRLIGVRYRIDELIGEGAMGSVYRGTHVPLERPVAIKCMHPHLSAMTEMVQRFTAEARLAAKLNHENIVTVYDFGVDDGESEGTLFIVMEFLAGPSLASTLQYTTLSVRQAVDLQVQLLAGLEHAHVAGIVHRDVSPANIILEPRATGETVKLIDFGVARNSSSDPLTEPGQVIGAPYYMSPEQVTGAGATFLSDIYSAGAVLYELLTGSAPFEGEDVDEVLRRRLAEPELNPREAAPERNIPEAVSDVCRRATAFEPKDRFSSARVFARALGIAASATTKQSYSQLPHPIQRRSSYPAALSRSESETPVPARTSGSDGADFHLLLRLEKKANAAHADGDVVRAIEELLRGVRAATALYNGGQHEIGASAVFNFAKRAYDLLVQTRRFEEAKGLLGSVLGLLSRGEAQRSELLTLLSRVEQQIAHENEMARIEAVSEPQPSLRAPNVPNVVLPKPPGT